MTLHVNDLFIFSGLRFGKFLGISFMHSHTEQSDFRILMKPISYNYPILQGADEGKGSKLIDIKIVQCTVLQMFERSKWETVIITVHAKMIMPHFNGLYIK